MNLRAFSKPHRYFGMDHRTVGILGGGQLGRMLVEAANRLNINTVVLDVENAPAKQVNALTHHVDGSYAEPARVRELASQCHIITAEIEHVNTDVLEEITEDETIRKSMKQASFYQVEVEVQPSWRTIRVIQDKYIQKEHLQSCGVETAQSIPLESGTAQDLALVVGELGLPCMLKSRKEAYDGRGNYPIRTTGGIPAALAALGGRELYVERWVSFTMELAVMVVKREDEASSSSTDPNLWKTTTLSFPVVETIHENSVCKLVYAPARNVSADIMQRADTLARRAVASFWGKGVFGVEMFLLDDGTLLVNEIAPRPHNSGHYSIEACSISQYEAHLRAILELPFPYSPTADGQAITSPGTQMLTPDTHAVMLNILGGLRRDSSSHRVLTRRALMIPGASVHLYGKGADSRPGRKMGHITIVADSMAECERRLAPLLQLLDQLRSDERASVEQSTSATTTTTTTEKKPAVVEPGPTASQMAMYSPGRATVGVTMGSDSDLPVLKPGLDLLRDLDIPFEVTITSAHRTPARMVRYALYAADRGIKVIIAAAGGAAHLPGMLASYTPLPVIGVPVKGSTLDGMDSLLSIVQMPKGVPVATVSINNSINAALLAARILGASDGRIRSRLVEYALDMERGVLEKVERLKEEGLGTRWSG